MDVKVLTQEDTSLTLRFDDTDPTIVNSIRRTLLADVPKMAIEDVEFHLGPIRAEDGKEYESVAPLFDEIISHRLGLVPIPLEGGREGVRGAGGEAPAMPGPYPPARKRGGHRRAPYGLQELPQVRGRVRREIREGLQRPVEDPPPVRNGREPQRAGDAH